MTKDVLVTISGLQVIEQESGVEPVISGLGTVMDG